mmetsp:Transcript_103430/g.331622  ORF Transcript_103430/g.331622 Transcript_103430/m.331622 type:complete len:99 (+) Transcript_103430:711-1007(+)
MLANATACLLNNAAAQFWTGLALHRCGWAQQEQQQRPCCRCADNPPGVTTAMDGGDFKACAKVRLGASSCAAVALLQFAEPTIVGCMPQFIKGSGTAT